VIESSFTKLQEDHKELELKYIEATNIKIKQVEDEDAKLKQFHDDQVNLRPMTRRELELCLVTLLEIIALPCLCDHIALDSLTLATCVRIHVSAPRG